MSIGSERRRPERYHGRAHDAADRPCDQPGCAAAGEFRAPGASRRSGDWRWLCLDHVRAFNAGYNYFAGMDSDEIERAQRLYAGWETETRAFASAGGDGPTWARFIDPADVLTTRFGSRAGSSASTADGLSQMDRRALDTLGLKPDASRADLRRAYAERLRRFHPDRNGGDRSQEKALQAAISAYTHLKASPAFASRSP